jgi:HEAT repeat protein
MPMTMKQVLAEIDRDEPNYAALAKLGKDALPHLHLIIDADDPLRASKAAYAVALIGGAGSAEALQKAAEHQDPQVRIAVAHALRNSTGASRTSRIKMLDRLLDDQDAGVRKVALSAVGDMPTAMLRKKVAALAENDSEEYIRVAAAKATRKVEPKAKPKRK